MIGFARRSIVGMSVAVAASGGCGKIPELDSRYGPGPTIAIDAVETKLARQNAVMTVLRRFAEETGNFRNANELWYAATELGFNYVDEECSEYLRLNFRLTRMQKRDAGILDVLGKNASGLLSAARVADPTITTVSTAFGVGSQLTDAWLNSYLFDMQPELVFRTVTKLQNRYREQIAAKKSTVVSAAVSYRVIQNYYTLCFPQTIEAKMSEYIAESVATDGSSEKPKTGTPPTPAFSAATIDVKLGVAK